MIEELLISATTKLNKTLTNDSTYPYVFLESKESTPYLLCADLNMPLAFIHIAPPYTNNLILISKSFKSDMQPFIDYVQNKEVYGLPLTFKIKEY